METLLEDLEYWLLVNGALSLLLRVITVIVRDRVAGLLRLAEYLNTIAISTCRCRRYSYIPKTMK